LWVEKTKINEIIGKVMMGCLLFLVRKYPSSLPSFQIF